MWEVFGQLSSIRTGRYSVTKKALHPLPSSQYTLTWWHCSSPDGGDQSDLALYALSLAPSSDLGQSLELAKTKEILDRRSHILQNLFGYPFIWAIVKHRWVFFVPLGHMSGNGGSKCWGGARELARRSHYCGPFDPSLLVLKSMVSTWRGKSWVKFNRIAKFCDINFWYQHKAIVSWTSRQTRS